jgi:hypothetical protein
LLTKGHNICARLNLKSGSAADFHILASSWHFHPNAESDPTDVAVCPFDEAQADFDIRQLQLDHGVIHETIVKNKVGPGNEIGVVGLFISHAGNERNIPVVRIGHLAALRGEPLLNMRLH